MRASRSPNDSGMTIIEIMVATVVLFIGVTAIMGLMASSLHMGILSKKGNITINAVSSFIEQIRAMPYEEIGTVGGDPSGSLESSMTLGPVEGVTIAVNVTVDWVNDAGITGANNYKRVRVRAESIGGRPYRYETETLIREADNNRPDNAEPPIVAFGPLTPGPQAVVTGLVDIDWTASSPMENGIITKVYLLGGGTFLRGVSGGVLLVDGSYAAEWPLNEPSGSGVFRWDTTMMKVDEYGFSTGERLYPDGPFDIYVEAWDNLVQNAARVRRVYIDNEDPNPVVSVTGAPVTATNAAISWPHATDGSGYADSYRIRFLRQKANESQILPGNWYEEVGYSTSNTNSYTQTTIPFSRYLASVQAVSIGGRLSSWTAFDDLSVTMPYVSRSRLSGTYTNTFNGAGANRTVTTDVAMSLTSPTFDFSDLTNELYRATNSQMSDRVLVASGSVFSYTHRANDSYNIHKDPIPQHYYQVRTILRPLGYPDESLNAVVEVWSNVLGPNGTLDSGPWPMPEVW